MLEKLKALKDKLRPLMAEFEFVKSDEPGFTNDMYVHAEDEEVLVEVSVRDGQTSYFVTEQIVEDPDDEDSFSTEHHGDFVSLEEALEVAISVAKRRSLEASRIDSPELG